MLDAFASFLLAISGTTAVQPQPQPQPAQPGPPQNILVIGDRLADLRARLAACLARHCPPNEDIDATTALAELLFDAGEYRDARSVLLASIGRNRREAARFPEPVSELYRANAVLARHLGFDADAKHSTWEILHTLQRGIPVEDARHFTARLEVIESLIAYGEYYQAQQQLNALATRARAAGRDDVVAATELRGLWLEYMQEPHNGEVVRRLTALSTGTDVHRAIGARMMLVRIYNERGRTREADQLIAQIAGRGTHRQLLFAPNFELAQQENVAGGGTGQEAIRRGVVNGGGAALVDNLADRMTDIYDQLIDVAFRIRPDGTVTDVQIVNNRGAPGWAPPLIRSISGRRYAVARDGGETFRVERYSYTAERRTEGLTATHISNRSPRGRVEFHELSETDIPAAPRTGSL